MSEEIAKKYVEFVDIDYIEKAYKNNYNDTSVRSISKTINSQYSKNILFKTPGNLYGYHINDLHKQGDHINKYFKYIEKYINSYKCKITDFYGKLYKESDVNIINDDIKNMDDVITVIIMIISPIHKTHIFSTFGNYKTFTKYFMNEYHGILSIANQYQINEVYDFIDKIFTIKPSPEVLVFDEFVKFINIKILLINILKAADMSESNHKKRMNIINNFEPRPEYNFFYSFYYNIDNCDSSINRGELTKSIVDTIYENYKLHIIDISDEKNTDNSKYVFSWFLYYKNNCFKNFNTTDNNLPNTKIYNNILELSKYVNISTKNKIIKNLHLLSHNC